MPWVLGCTLWGRSQGRWGLPLCMEGSPFIYKVTLVSNCSRVAFGKQPDLGIDCSGLQRWGPLQAHLENAHLVG